MEMSARRRSAVVLMVIGIVLLNAPPMLAQSMHGASDRTMAALYALPVFGLALFVLGIYRLATNGRSKP